VRNRKAFVVFCCAALLTGILVGSAIAEKSFVIDNFDTSEQNALGGRRGTFKRPPSFITVAVTHKDYHGKSGCSLEIDFAKKEQGWCGYYTTLKKGSKYFDASKYRSFVFWVRGTEGGESFECGMSDEKWDKKGDSLKCGQIEIYLPGGVTKKWQKVVVPLSDFGDLDFSKLASVVINFPNPGEGRIYVDDLSFTKEETKVAIPQGETLLIHNFDTNLKNALGGRIGFYKRSPSKISVEPTTKEHYGKEGSALQIDFDKQEEGWCGWYTILKRGLTYLDASSYKYISFQVKGKKGGEDFVVGLADRGWEMIDDSLKSDQIWCYLKSGKVTTKWQEAVIPLDTYQLEMSELASLSINFNEEGSGTIYIDNITLKRK